MNSRNKIKHWPQKDVLNIGTGDEGGLLQEIVSNNDNNNNNNNNNNNKASNAHIPLLRVVLFAVGALDDASEFEARVRHDGREVVFVALSIIGGHNTKTQ